jgi:1-aminocyclopropane-1-carboxylate deaminase/D-cysteine desulfhydrase-like pyridoxal-dependent ACC family enzyme
LGDHGRVLGVDVGARPDLEAFLAGTATAVASLAGRPTPTGTPVVDHDHVGPGYAVATPAGRAAAGLAARTEGLVLDPVYTSKALAGLVTAAREGALPDGRVVFVHTGGLPGLFAAGMSSWVTS